MDLLISRFRIRNIQAMRRNTFLDGTGSYITGFNDAIDKVTAHLREIDAEAAEEFTREVSRETRVELVGGIKAAISPLRVNIDDLAA
jgi:hypothetical protein